MNIKSYTSIEPTKFDSDKVKGVAARVVIGKKDGAGNFCMRIFEVSPGGFTPRHSHDWEHEIFVHSGKGEFLGSAGWTPAKAGDAVFIPSNEEHQIKNISNEKLIFACLVPGKAPEL